MRAPRRKKTSYLLDPRFQLKWTGYLVVVVLLVMTALGIVIGRTAGHASETASLAVTQAEKAFEESRSNSILARRSVQMAAPENAGLAAIMDQSLAEVDSQSEKNLADVRKRQQEIARDRTNIKVLLAASAASLIAILLLMGIVITHRIVGPVHHMKKLLRRVSTGRLVIDERLRRGDELSDLFETFLQMTYSLRAMQRARVATLDGALSRAAALNTDPEVIDEMRALRAQMVVGMEPRRASMYPKGEV